WWCGYVDNVLVFHACGLYAQTQHFCGMPASLDGEVQALDEFACIYPSESCLDPVPTQQVDATYGGDPGAGFGYTNWSRTADNHDCGCSISWTNLTDSASTSVDEPTGQNWWYNQHVNLSTPWRVKWNR